MKGSAWLLPAAALLAFLAAVGWPLIACIELLATAVGDAGARGVASSTTAQLLATSFLWSGAVMVSAMLLGWAPGRFLGKALARGTASHSSWRMTHGSSLLIGVLLLVPVCLPAYVVFFAWWQAWPADSWLFRWAVEHRQVQTVRHMTLLVGLLCWSWPIVSWCVAGFTANTPPERDEMLRLDGASGTVRLMDKLRCDGRGLILGGLIVFLATFSNTTVFDLAEIFTFGNELRAIEALGATPREVLTAAAPATLITAIGAAVVWMLLSGGRNTAPALRAGSRARRWGAAPLAIAMLWIVSVGVPVALLARNMRRAAGGRSFGEQLSEFSTFYGRGLVNGIVLALVCGAIGVIIAAGLAWMWQDRAPGRGWVRGLAHVQAVGWIVAAAVPGTMVGSALTAAYNRGVLADWIYLTPAVLVIGHLARFGFIAALLGRWIAVQEPRALADLRALDGAVRFRGLLVATWPRLLAAGGATFGIVLVLSLAEIPVIAQVRPPGLDLITPSILNDMHYQRPQTVMIATAVFMALALAAAAGALVMWTAAQRSVQSARWT